MKIRNMQPAGISVGPADFYKPDATGDRSPVNKPEPMNASAMAAYVASLPRVQRRKIDQNAKRALRKYKKHPVQSKPVQIQVGDEVMSVADAQRLVGEQIVKEVYADAVPLPLIRSQQ